MPTEKNAAFLPTQYSFKLDRQRVKYECSGVYIVVTSRQKLLIGIKGIFNKVVS